MLNNHNISIKRQISTDSPLWDNASTTFALKPLQVNNVCQSDTMKQWFKADG